MFAFLQYFDANGGASFWVQARKNCFSSVLGLWA